MFCTIHLSKSDPTPLYIQLANALAHLIKTGDLPNHTKLPTIRTLSKKLSINRDTVVNAYKLLENQGLVTAYVGSGTYVSSPQTSTPSTPAQTISCSSLSFNKNYFPPSLITKLTQEMINAEGWNVFSDPLYRGHTTLKQNICEFLKSVGVNSSSSQLRYTKDFLNFLVDLLKTHPNSTICVEAYHDLSYSSFLRSLGFKVIELPLTQDGIDLDYLGQLLQTEHISFVWVSTYVQNPTGISYNLETKKNLLELARKHQFYIIEDGTLSDFAYTENILLPLYTLDDARQVIYIYHFSKLYLPSVQYSFIALPHGLCKKLNEPTTCSFNERFLQYYLDSSIFSSIRQDIVETHYHHFNTILPILQELAPYIELYSEQGSLFFWIKPRLVSTCIMEKFLLQSHILLAPGELFTMKSKCLYTRLSLAHLNDSTLPLVIEGLKGLATLSS
ncbi:MAG: PLP-dependent aminotransferase family protein [Niameybacter sp.]|uniref:aminotransferase-like domain-containing protein n=1 Tax=Niameybacter sp. TaxID=2033640 RepID=UPI002FC986AD